MPLYHPLSIRLDPDTGYGEATQDGITFTSDGSVILGNEILLDGQGIDYFDGRISIYREPKIGAQLIITSVRNQTSRRYVFREFHWSQLFDTPNTAVSNPDIVDRVEELITERFLPVAYRLTVIFLFVAALAFGVLYAIFSI